jgi:hypothetical protein
MRLKCAIAYLQLIRIFCVFETYCVFSVLWRICFKYMNNKYAHGISDDAHDVALKMTRR